MANEKDLVEDENVKNTGGLKEKREKHKKEKKDRKDAKGKTDSVSEDTDEEKTGSKLVLAFVTVLIVVIWLAIIALLIKM